MTKLSDFDDIAVYAETRDRIFKMVVKKYGNTIKEGEDLEYLKKYAKKLSKPILEFINEYSPPREMCGFTFFRYTLCFLGFLVENSEPCGFVNVEEYQQKEIGGFDGFFDLLEHGPILSFDNSDIIIVDEQKIGTKDYVNFVICPGKQEGTIYKLVEETLELVLDKFRESLKGKKVVVSSDNVRILNKFKISSFNDGQIFFRIDSVKKLESKTEGKIEEKTNEKLDALYEYLKTKLEVHPHVYTQLENAISFILKSTVNYDKGEQDFVLVFDEEKKVYLESKLNSSR